jgi:hypothetical protein
MLRYLPLVFAVGLLGALGLRVYDQDRRIARLREDLEALRASAAREPLAERAPRGPDPLSAARAAGHLASNTDIARAMPRAQVAEAPASGAAPRPVPRAPVTPEEIERVESAVLSLLESERPVLREKLRAAVAEQRDALDQEQQEQRRERWIARIEARLAEPTGAAALTAAQRQTILDLIVANRDQITDLMRSADSSADFTAARGTIRQLRTETDAKIRELLNDAQYKAYKESQRDEDDRRPGPPPGP